jgi:hypothetical protein
MPCPSAFGKDYKGLYNPDSQRSTNSTVDHGRPRATTGFVVSAEPTCMYHAIPPYSAVAPTGGKWFLNRSTAFVPVH